jgi:CelD/BcsL family acetyltransferase involved in cellulose biosynthesis
MTDPPAGDALVARIETPGAVAEPWRALAEVRGNAFITPEWFAAWHRQFGDPEPAVLVARDGAGSVRGVMPLLSRSPGRSGRVRFADRTLADHLHPAAEVSDEAAVAAACGSALGSQRNWRVIVLDHVDAGAAWTQAFAAAAAGPGSAARAYRNFSLPEVDLSQTDSWEHFLARRSRNFRSQMGRFERRLARDHRLAFRVTETASELEGDLASLFRLQDIRWPASRGSEALLERVRAFHREFASAALARGWLRLWLLELDGEPAAGWYGWRLGDRYVYYWSAFAPRLAELRPGLVLLAHTVRSAIDEGAGAYDMLLGNEPFKGRFANSRREIESLLIARSRLGDTLAAGEAGAWRLSRRLSAYRARRAR